MGFISLGSLLFDNLPIPHYTSICRRAKILKIKLDKPLKITERAYIDVAYDKESYYKAYDFSKRNGAKIEIREKSLLEKHRREGYNHL